MQQSNFYENRLTQYGPNDPRAVAWNSKESQRIRYDVLVLIADIDGSSILDVGCGVGDFFGYLKEKKFNIKYTGIDISEKLIEAAQKKYPDGTFEIKDILKEDRKFDYVFAAGVFGLQGTHKDFKGIIKKMFYLANKGVAFSMLSSYADKSLKESKLDYFNPERIFKICKTLTPMVCLRHDYLPHDFTIYMYK